MKTTFLSFSVLGVILTAIATTAVADDAKEAAIRKDRRQLAGTWRVVAFEINGIKSTEEDAKPLTVVNGADGTWSLCDKGKEIRKGTSTIDPTKKPKSIDFKEEGKDQYLGIYELGEKTRKLCFAPPSEERPTEFSMKPGKHRILMTFERGKAK